MHLDDILLIIENERRKGKITKRALCRAAGITPQHYDRLLKGMGSTTFRVVESMLDYLDLEMVMSPIIPHRQPVHTFGHR